MKKKISGNSFGILSKIKNITVTRLILFGTVIIVCGLAAIFSHQTSFAEHQPQNIDEVSKKQAENVWQTVETSRVSNRAKGLPDDFQTLKLDSQKLAFLLQAAPHEAHTPLKDSELILQFPMPDGTFSRFRVQEAPVLEPSLQEQFPEIKSYRVFGIDAAAATGRFDFTPQGFHATIISPVETISILPADEGDDSLYAVYNNLEQSHFDGDGATCGVKEEPRGESDRIDSPLAPPTSVGSTLRTYDMAFSTTYEYTRDIGGGTRNGTVSSINTWLNAMNAIYERELSIRLIMVKGSDTNLESIYTTSNDPYDDRVQNSNDPNDNNSSLLMRAVRDVLRDKVGTDNYNIGHLLTKNTKGGVAGLGVVCSNDTKDYSTNPATDGIGAAKGAGFSSLSLPIGNIGALKVFAHEVGHQFGANHTFNAQIGGCAGTNRSPISSYEVGSGNTIMSYFGVCGGYPAPPNLTDNVTGISDMRFHGHSFDQITDFVINNPVGKSCGKAKSAGNAPPTANAGINYTIPMFTPFTLTATGSDTNTGDQNNLTYAWEQFQPGGTDYYQNGTDASYTDAGDSSTTTRPIFRATPASRNPSRTFPSLEYILNNANDPPNIVSNLRTAEELPRVGRTLPFRVTVRDNITGVSNSLMTVTIDGSKGPFTIFNDPSGIWTGGTSPIVQWNVNNTNALAAKVKISLSTDGGLTFPYILAANADNNGSASVIVPNGINTTAARVKVEAVGNIFFDISNANFTIAPGNSCPVINDFNPKVAAIGSQIVIEGVNFTGANSVTFNGTPASVFTASSDGKQITATVPNGATGGKIVVSKSGCPAAQSTANFVVCPGSQQTLQIDTGTDQPLVGGATGPVYLVNRLKPASYPATLNSITIKFPGYGGFPSSTDVTILSGSTSNGIVNNTTFRTKKDTAKLGETKTYNVDPIIITSGEFVVGYSIDRGTSYYFPAEIDANRKQGDSYKSSDGVNFTAEPGGTYRIRAGVYSGQCSGICSYTVTTSGQYFTGEGGESTINISTQVGCPWQIARRNDWLNVLVASGTGSGTVVFTVNENTSSVFRVGSFVVGPPTDNQFGNKPFENNLSRDNLLKNNLFKSNLAENELLEGEEIIVEQEALAPTAAPVTISGRVSNAAGKGLSGAIVSFVEQTGQTRISRTNSFGYYRLPEVPSGNTYVVNVRHKSYHFAPQIINLTNNLDGLNFTGYLTY